MTDDFLMGALAGFMAAGLSLPVVLKLIDKFDSWLDRDEKERECGRRP